MPLYYVARRGIGDNLAAPCNPDDMTMWTDVVSALAAAGTFVVAVAAALFAYRQVGEARRLREEQAQPYVFVDLVPSPASSTLVDIVIKNVGATVARNVRFRFEPSIVSTLYPHAASEAKELSEYSLFVNGIPTLPPGAEVRFLFESAPDRYQRRQELPATHRVTVTFDDSRERPCEPAEYVLDLDRQWGLLRVGVRTVHTIGKTLEQIKDIMARRE